MSNLSSNIDTGCMSDGQSSITGSSLGLSGHPTGQRTKRMRTSFKHHQLRTMKSYFSINQNPDAKDLKQLAQKTGLSKRVLQVIPLTHLTLFFTYIQCPITPFHSIHFSIISILMPNIYVFVIKITQTLS